MSVVINEFEILVDPPATASAEPSQREQLVAPLRPEEVLRIVRHFDNRRRRVDAD